MNHNQKEKVRQLREAGSNYAKIAQTLDLSENTVKSYCKRNNFIGKPKLMPAGDDVSLAHCSNCAAPLVQTAGRKAKKFCSDRCRMAWWNTHSCAMGRKGIRSFSCHTCGQHFEAYGKRERKYCSRACYGKSKALMP